MNYKDELEFEIYIADLIEQYKPKSITQLEIISETLHDCVEVGIRDYVEGTDGALNYEDYTPCY